MFLGKDGLWRRRGSWGSLIIFARLLLNHKNLQTLNISKFIKAIFILLLLLPLFSSGQTNLEDVVYLKNGNIVHGIIVEQIINQTIKIKTKYGDIFIFRMDEIDKIIKEPVPSFDSNNVIDTTLTKEKGTINISEAECGIGYGRVNYGKGLGFVITTVNGYQINKHFSIGLGIGYSYQPNLEGTGFKDIGHGKYKLMTIPVFVDLRYNLTRKKHAFFTYIDLGRSFLLSPSSTYSNNYYQMSQANNNIFEIDEVDDGFASLMMYGIGLGYKFYLSHNMAWTISFGNDHLGIRDIIWYYTYYINNQHSTSSSSSTFTYIGNYFAIRTGFIF